MKPNRIKECVFEHYPYRIELHAHTNPASSCSDVTPAEMARIYKDLGYHGLCLTNHFSIPSDGRDKETFLYDYLQDFEETAKAGEALGLSVYLCAEIRFTECSNDYLLFGADRDLLSRVYDFLPDGIARFATEFDRKGALLVQAHPKRKNMKDVDPAFLDGLEVYNMHPSHNSCAGVASRYAKENGLSLITAGSDFHHKDRGHEGLAALRAARLPKDSYDLACLLREEDYVFELGKGNLLIP